MSNRQTYIFDWSSAKRFRFGNINSDVVEPYMVFKFMGLNETIEGMSVKEEEKNCKE
jgi:hypothetical protein